MPLAARVPHAYHLPQRVAAILLASACLTTLLAQTPTPQPPPDTPAIAATRAEATRTRDAFVARVKAAGFTCPLAAPTILVEDVPSFGQYDDEKNVLRTSDWTVLNPEERAAFLQFAGPSGSEADARAIFEIAAHQWILIHELGHWWQNCTRAINDKNPWKMEFDADRIALAFWREADPTVVTHIEPVFHQVVDMMPDPTPPGQQMIPYFNANYQKLGPTPAYRWYQSKMNVAADDQRPIPTFKQILTAIQQPS